MCAVQVGASQGWARCNHPSRHFWRGGRALCSRYLQGGAAALEVSDVPSPRDCKACRRRRAAELGNPPHWSVVCRDVPDIVHCRDDGHACVDPVPRLPPGAS